MDSSNNNTGSYTPPDELNSLTDWENEPTLMDLKQDFTDAKPAHDTHTCKVRNWLDHLNIEGSVKIAPTKNRSSIQPKLIRKNNEWRYPSLSEPFLSTPNIFNISPYTWEDKEAARQNELLLNYQFNNRIDKVAFIDETVRTAVDEGTVFVRVGWEFEEKELTVLHPTYSFRPARIQSEVEDLQHAMQGHFPAGISEVVDEDSGDIIMPETSTKAAWEQALQYSQEQGAPIVPTIVEFNEVTQMETVKNQPVVEVVPYENLTIDPSCNGDLSKAKFAVYQFETSKSDLEAAGIYKNIDEIQADTNSILGAPDFDTTDDSSFNFKDDPRKKFVAHEYWGYWDINGTGLLEPIVATWVGATLIRMEINPYPDKKIPFVSAQYLPKRKSLYGEPDGELLIDNQKIAGALTRGMVDIVARSANGQVGMRKDMLDVTNRRKYQKGEDYEFNQTVDPRQGVHMHTFAEIPNSAPLMLQEQKAEANEMTGVRPYGSTSNGLNGGSATEARGVIDAASKRETAILRRIAQLVKGVGEKIISMNQEFLDDEEIIRVTNDDFVAIKREDLAGSFDLVMSISTTEEDNAKAAELSFMLQTVGPNADPKMMYDIMADVADLRRMPELAERLRNYEPQPDPLAEAMRQEELRELQLKNAKVEAEIQKIYADAGLSQQKAGTETVKQGNIQSDTDKKNLDFVEQESGVQQERALEKDGAQAKANLTRDLINNAFKQSSGNDTSA